MVGSLFVVGSISCKYLGQHKTIGRNWYPHIVGNGNLNTG